MNWPKVGKVYRVVKPFHSEKPITGINTPSMLSCHPSDGWIHDLVEGDVVKVAKIRNTHIDFRMMKGPTRENIIRLFTDSEMAIDKRDLVEYEARLAMLDLYKADLLLSKNKSVSLVNPDSPLDPFPKIPQDVEKLKDEWVPSTKENKTHWRIERKHTEDNIIFKKEKIAQRRTRLSEDDILNLCLVRLSSKTLEAIELEEI